MNKWTTVTRATRPGPSQSLQKNIWRWWYWLWTWANYHSNSSFRDRERDSHNVRWWYWINIYMRSNQPLILMDYMITRLKHFMINKYIYIYIYIIYSTQVYYHCEPVWEMQFRNNLWRGWPVHIYILIIALILVTKYNDILNRNNK